MRIAKKAGVIQSVTVHVTVGPADEFGGSKLNPNRMVIIPITIVLEFFITIPSFPVQF